MSPPMRKLMYRGARLEMSFDGPTTFRSDVHVERRDQQRDEPEERQQWLMEAPSSSTGFRIGLPKTTADADVTAMPRNENSTIATGRPIA